MKSNIFFLASFVGGLLQRSSEMMEVKKLSNHFSFSTTDNFPKIKHRKI